MGRLPHRGELAVVTRRERPRTVTSNPSNRERRGGYPWGWTMHRRLLKWWDMFLGVLHTLTDRHRA